MEEEYKLKVVLFFVYVGILCFVVFLFVQLLFLMNYCLLLYSVRLDRIIFLLVSIYFY